MLRRSALRRRAMLLVLAVLLCRITLGALPQQMASPTPQYTLKPVAIAGVTRRSYCGARSTKTGTIRPLKVMFVVSYAYIEVTLNWLIFYQRVCPNRSLLYFLCTDVKVKDRLGSYGMMCDEMINVQGSVFNVWKVRAKVAMGLLSQGIDVLMSDADAIWLRNPFQVIEKYIDNADIIASRGLFPELLSRKYGATMCMGFIYLKSTHNVVSLWSDLTGALNISRRMDDQNELNFLLWRKGLRYYAPIELPSAAVTATKTKKSNNRQEHKDIYNSNDNPYRVGYINTTTEAVGEFFVETVPSKVVLLPHEHFKRTCEGEPLLHSIHEATIAHCYTLKYGILKHRGLYLMELWLLRHDWMSVPYRNSTELFFNDITLNYTGMASPVYSKEEDNVYSSARKSDHRRKKGDDPTYEDRLVKMKKLAKSTVHRAPVGRKNTRTYSEPG